MKTKFTLTIAILILSTNFLFCQSPVSMLDYGNAPAWNWTEHFGGTNANSVTGHIVGMDTDPEGNFYTFGYVSGETDYFGTTFQEGTFLCKQNPSGNLLWHVTFSGLMVDYYLGNYITSDPAGEYIYITGGFDNAFNIPGGPQLTPAGGGSIFIIKYDNNGSYIGYIQEDIGSSGLFCLAADHSGHILLSSTFGGQILISGQSLVSSGMEDAFIARYDASLDLDWVVQAGGNDQEYVGLISADDSDNIYFTGEFWSENVQVGNSSFVMNDGDGNIILAKILSNGTTAWITSKAGSIANEGWGDTYCWPTGIKTDSQGYTYIKGWHGDSTWFDGHMLRSPYFDFSFFIAKFDNSGNTLWANSIQEHDNGFDYNQFDCDAEGNVYLGAEVSDKIHFGDNFEYINAGPSDIFVARYLSNGVLDWVKTCESTTGGNWISSVVVCDTNLYIGGHFSDYIKLDDEVLVSEVQHGFIAMTGENTLGFKEIFRNKDDMISISPNPFSDRTLIGFNNPAGGEYRLQIFDLSGSKVYQQHKITTNRLEFERGDLPAGVYIVELRGEKVFRGKMVVR